MYSKKSQSELIENKDYNMVLLLPHNATKIIYFSKSFSIRFFLLVIKEYYVFLKVAANGGGIKCCRLRAIYYQDTKNLMRTTAL